MRHAEFLGHCPFGRVGVDADDLVSADHPRALDHVETDAAKSEHRDVRAGPDFRGVDDGADAGRHTTADVADLVEGCVFANFGERNFRQHRKIGEGRAAHVVKDRVAVAAETAGAVRHQAFALRGSDRRTKIGSTRETGFALAALRRVERNDMIANFQRAHTRTNIAYDARAFVAQDCRKQTFWVRA